MLKSSTLLLHCLRVGFWELSFGQHYEFGYQQHCFAVINLLPQYCLTFQKNSSLCVLSAEKSSSLSTMIQHSCSSFYSYIDAWIITTCEIDSQTSTTINCIILCFYLEYKPFKVSNQSAQSIYCTGCNVEPMRFFCLSETFIQRIVHWWCWWRALLPREASPVTVLNTLHYFHVQNSPKLRLYSPRAQFCFYYDVSVATVSATSGKVSCSSCSGATIRSSCWLHDIDLLYMLQ